MKFKRWQDDKEFGAWLVSMEYVDSGGKPYMAGGIYIYLWEAWRAGLKRGGLSKKERKGREFRPCAYCDKPFEVSLFSTGKRSDAVYCSKSCQVMTSRKRTMAKKRETAE